MEAPLVEPQDLIDERRTINQSLKEWKTNGKPTSTWFSYVMNNYWHTNYKADQEGTSYYHYVLRPHGTADRSLTEKTAFEVCQPLLAFQTKAEAPNKGLFSLTNSKIVVTCVIPSQGGYIVRLFNPENSPQRTAFQWTSKKPVRVTAITSNNSSKGEELLLQPLAILDVKLDY
jgi:hypothetical protein